MGCFVYTFKNGAKLHIIFLKEAKEKKELTQIDH